MATLAELHRGVRAALASKRLGQPVFVRYHAQGVLDAEGAVLPALARLAVEVGDWMGEPPSRLYQLQARKGHFSILLQFARGGTALLSTSDGVKGGPHGPLLMVLGNQ